MHNPNPIPDVGSRWLKFQPRRGTPVEVEVLARDARHTSGDRLITYREVATEYVRTIRFKSWRQPSMVAPVPSASAAPSTSASAPAAPTVGATRADAAAGAPPCKVCGKPAAPRLDRGGTHGLRWRSTCSDECLAESARANMMRADAARAARLSERNAASNGTVAPLAPPAPRDSQLRRAERGDRLTIYLPHELARALRIRCAEDNRSASDAVSTALLAWLTSPT